MTFSPGRTTALVISGGGAKGAFAVGAIANLHARFADSGWFSIVGGSSAGALIAPFAALLGAPEPVASQALDTLVSFTTRVSTADLLGRRGPLGLLRRRDSLNETEGLQAVLSEALRPEWFRWLASADAPEVYVVYTNYRTGRKGYASPREPGMDRERFLRAMLASASVPVYMEPAFIDGEPCFDGGVRDIVPCERAIELGAELIVPIQLDPRDPPLTLGSTRRLDGVLLRTVAILLDETRTNDMERAELFAAAGRLKAGLRETLGSSPRLLAQVEELFDEPGNRALFGPENRLVEVVPGLRPDAVLTDDVLSFVPSRMQLWAAMGARKASEVIVESPFESAPAGPKTPATSAQGGHERERRESLVAA